MKKGRLAAKLLCGLMILLLALPWGALAEDDASTRWADAADKIDQYLDAAFESYLDGAISGFMKPRALSGRP